MVITSGMQNRAIEFVVKSCQLRDCVGRHILDWPCLWSVRKSVDDGQYRYNQVEVNEAEASLRGVMLDAVCFCTLVRLHGSQVRIHRVISRSMSGQQYRDLMRQIDHIAGTIMRALPVELSEYNTPSGEVRACRLQWQRTYCINRYNALEMANRSIGILRTAVSPVVLAISSLDNSTSGAMLSLPEMCSTLLWIETETKFIVPVGWRSMIFSV